MIAEFILIGEAWHRATLNPVIFSLGDQRVFHEERYRRAGHELDEQTFKGKVWGDLRLFKYPSARIVVLLQWILWKIKISNNIAGNDIMCCVY